MSYAHLYEYFAKLLCYPDEDYIAAGRPCHEAARESCEEAEQNIGEFLSRMEGRTREALQELFVQTFDLNPVCVLEVGWHLYGDNYDRGAFLVKTRERLRRHNIQESSELPDHLTHILVLLARMEADEASSFANESVIPALDKMLAGVAGKENPYGFLLLALRGTLACEHAPALQGVKHD